MINRFLQGFMGTPLLTFAVIIELPSCCLGAGTLICLSLFNHWSEALGNKLQHGEVLRLSISRNI